MRRADSELLAWLDAERVLIHPLVAGEVLMGSIAFRGSIRAAFDKLPAARLASHGEVMDLVDAHALFGRGIGFVDAHLLASARLTPDAMLATRDRRLAALARELGVA